MDVETAAPEVEERTGLPLEAIQPQEEMSPSRLWSLLEIMERFPVESYLVLVHVIGIATGTGITPSQRLAQAPFTPQEVEGFSKAFARFQLQGESFGLKASNATLSALISLCEPGKMNRAEFFRLLEELQGRLRDEMLATVFFGLSPSEASIFSGWFEKWGTVLDRFPEAVGDIEEASKCWALARYPAAIFHSVSIVECGLIELGVFIGVTDFKSGWTAVSNALSNIIKKKRDDLTPFEQANFTFLEQVHGTVEALKNAWRNKISHAQGRLVVLPGSFTPEIAEEILYATRSFMRRLAEGLPQPSP